MQDFPTNSDKGMIIIMEDGYVPPTQIARFYKVKDEVEALAIKSLENLNKFPYYPNLLPEMKRIFRT